MNFKKAFCDFLDCCKEEKQAISNYRNEQGILINKNMELYEMLNSLNNKNEQLVKEQFKLKEDLDFYKEAFKNPTDIPERKITYLRNVWYGKLIGWKKVPIQVQLFITPYDYNIVQELKARKLVLKDLNDLNTHVPKVYHLMHKLYYKYGSDKKYGFSEHWQMPFELMYGRKKLNTSHDCDDFSILHVSALRASGVPPDRILVSAGTTRSGFGHATIYVQSLDEGWKHLNSTLPHHKYASLTRFPSKNDKTDSIGIHPDKFWFSFNDRFAIHRFDEQQARKDFEKSSLKDKILVQ